MAKHRTSIEDQVRYLSDNTCCVCRKREKGIQIHHIDKDRNNNNIENLAVLCLECHDEAHKKGGLTRELNPSLITKYSNEWIGMVDSQRNKTSQNEVQHTQLNGFPRAFINSLPKFKSDLLQQIKKQKSGGTTLDIIEANCHYTNVLKGFLVTLAAFYSPEYFKDLSPQEFFSEIISERDRFHTMIAEPDGVGSGGTISGINRGCLRIKDIENLIEAMVYGLLYPKGSYDGIDYEDWQKLWRDSDIL